jgi:hypothetical protein
LHDLSELAAMRNRLVAQQMQPLGCAWQVGPDENAEPLYLP